MTTQTMDEHKRPHEWEMQPGAGIPRPGCNLCGQPQDGSIHQPVAVETRRADEASIAIMAKAEGFEIATAEQFEASGELLREIKGRQKDLADTRLGITRPMDDAKKRVLAAFKPSADRLLAAEATLKAAILLFTRGEEARLAEEQRQRDEVAKRERERLEAEAEKRRDEGAPEAAGVLQEAAAEVAPAPVATPTRAAGVHTVTTWHAEVTDKMALIRAASGDPWLAELLKVDMTQLNTLARRQKDGLRVPGVRAVSETGIAAKAR